MLVLALAGCGNAAADAEAEFRLTSQTGDACRAAAKAADAWLKQQDKKKYAHWVKERDFFCMAARASDS